MPEASLWRLFFVLRYSECLFADFHHSVAYADMDKSSVSNPSARIKKILRFISKGVPVILILPSMRDMPRCFETIMALLMMLVVVIAYQACFSVEMTTGLYYTGSVANG